MVKKKNTGGDCYFIAGKIALGDIKDIEFIGTPYLVHAEVRGQGALLGIRFGHAWIEDDEYVYDYSNNREIRLPKELYYILGDIKTDNTLKYRRYTFDQARERMIDTGNYGCWDIEVEYKKGGKIENWEDKDLVFYHEKNGNIAFARNEIYLWLYDDENAAEKLQNDEYDWVFYPLTTFYMAWAKGYVPPLKRIWTKKFQKEHRGSDKLIGCVKAYYDEANQKLIVDMMSVHPKMVRMGIMGYMIGFLRNHFSLTQEQVVFKDTTDEGKIFEEKKKFEDGGSINA